MRGRPYVKLNWAHVKPVFLVPRFPQAMAGSFFYPSYVFHFPGAEVSASRADKFIWIHRRELEDHVVLLTVFGGRILLPPLLSYLKALWQH